MGESWKRIKYPWIHIPEKSVAYCYQSKSASTSIAVALCKMLRLTGPVHGKLRPYTISMLDFWQKDVRNRCYTFTFVRNPFTRLASCYEQKIIIGQGNNFPSNFSPGMSFDAFIYEIQSIFPGNEHIHPYWPWLVDTKGKIFLNRVGKVENMIKDWHRVRVESPCSLPKIAVVNKTKHPHYRRYFKNPETKKIVRQLYKEDLDLFNYDF